MLHTFVTSSRLHYVRLQPKVVHPVRVLKEGALYDPDRLRQRELPLPDRALEHLQQIFKYYVFITKLIRLLT